MAEMQTSLILATAYTVSGIAFVIIAAHVLISTCRCIRALWKGDVVGVCIESVTMAVIGIVTAIGARLIDQINETTEPSTILIIALMILLIIGVAEKMSSQIIAGTPTFLKDP